MCFLKLYCTHIYRRQLFDMIYNSMDLLLWMNVILDFIFIGFTVLWWTGGKRKLQKDNICLQWYSNQQHSAPKAIILNRSATLTGYVLCLKVLHNDDIWIKPIGDNTCVKLIMVGCLFKLTQTKSAFLLQMYILYITVCITFHENWW